jgi:hypothetical protein
MYDFLLSDYAWPATDHECYVTVLEALRPFLPPPMFDKLAERQTGERFVLAVSAFAAAARPEFLNRALELAETQLDVAARSKALAAILPHAPAPTHRTGMASFVNCAAHLQRRELLPRLQLLIPMIAKIEGADGLANLVDSILEVGDWFP